VLPVAGTLEARACILPGMRAAVLLMICAAVAAGGCGRAAATSKPSPTASTGKARPAASMPVPARAEPPLPVWRVVSVADGDTLRAIDDSKAEHRIRLAGIDAPERGQPFGNVARERLAELTMGKAVAVDVEDRDRYGRTVARLEADGLDVCRQLVADGLAWHYTRYSKDAGLAAAEAAARAARRGLWRDPAPVPPWEWRASEAERKR
jgi:endonuclease YncB( thermonuclease family)